MILVMVVVAVVVMVVPGVIVIIIMVLVMVVVVVVIGHCSNSSAHGIMVYFLHTSTVKPVVRVVQSYSDCLWTGRSGIESRWGRDFPPVQTGPGVYPASCKIGTGSFPGVRCGRGTLLTTYPLLVPRSWKSRAIPLPTLWATQSL